MVACDVPSGVDASTGEVEGEAVRALATATFHGPKLGLHVAPGNDHAGRGARWWRSASRAARPAPAGAGPDLRARARALPAPAAQRLEVQLGRGGGGRRLARADRRADDGRALGRPARRRGLRAGGGARPGAAGARPAAARGDEPRPARRGRRPHAGGRGGRRGDGRARRRGGAGPGPGPREGALEFARGVAAAGRGAAADRRRRPERPRRAARARCASATAPTVLTPHAGELGPAARARLGRGGAPTGWPARARRPSAAAPWCCSRATTRSWPRPAGRWR